MTFWEKYPVLYDFIQVVATGGFLKVIKPRIIQLQNKTILDVGCGTGTLVDLLRPKEYLGVDINPQFIRLAKKKFPGRSFKVMDVTKDALPSKSFDYVLIMNVLHHLSDLELVGLLTKIKRWRRAKQVVIVESKPNGLVGNILGKFDAGSNFREYGKLKKIIKPYVVIKKSNTVTAPLGTYKYLILHCQI